VVAVVLTSQYQSVFPLLCRLRQKDEF